MKEFIFPPNFCWGVSTSAAQIEGNAQERDPIGWDHFSAIPGNIAGGHSPQVACDHVRHYKADVSLMKQLGVKAYRFSISQARWMAEEGKQSFYQRLIDELLDNGIEPWPTLSHFDIPQVLENEGGWLNRDTSRRFADYADQVARVFGDRVKHWMTVNEPNINCFQGYMTGAHHPGKRSPKDAFRAAHNQMLAHGLAMEAIRQTSSDAQVGIVFNMLPVKSLSKSPLSRMGAYTWRLLGTHWFLDPLLKGQYPAPVAVLYKTLISEVIHSGDMKIISKSMDFIGINYYLRQVIDAMGQWLKQVPGSEHTAMGWEICPAAFTKGLLGLKERYGSLLPPVYITENGAAFEDVLTEGAVNDPRRIAYLGGHIRALWQAMAAGVDVRGYFVWSLLDNFEWEYGYTKRFGLVHVDFDDPDRQRIPKDSYRWYQRVISQNGLPSANA